MAESGWREFTGARAGAEAFETTPFARLARAHALAVAGDTMTTVALAGTLFFSIDPSEARSRVFLYLALTMAPFAVVAPLVGPALDRAPGGRRWMVVGSSGLRALVCFLMIRDVDSLLLFPEAFAFLVLSKGYQVAKSALVPSVVRSDNELVQANSKLALLSGVVGALAAAPAGLILQVGDSEAVLAVTSIVFVIGVVVSLQLPKTSVAPVPATEEEQEELRSTGVLLAATAMGLFRGIVGFLTFLLAFGLRTENYPAWQFGLVIAISAGGAMVGAGIAPELRKMISEERIISVLLVTVAVSGVVGAWSGALLGAAIVAGAVGICAAAAKQAFDAIVQRDAPDANRGRSFARFESRFQIIWVIGATLGVIRMPMQLGFLLITAVAVFAAVTYTAGSRGAQERWARRLARAARRRMGSGRNDLDDSPSSTPQLPPTIVTPVQPEPPSPPADAREHRAVPPGVATPASRRGGDEPDQRGAGAGRRITDQPSWRRDREEADAPGDDETSVLPVDAGGEDATLVDDPRDRNE